MEIIVIACYKPKPGKEEMLPRANEAAPANLKSQGLVTDRESIMMQAADGTVLEVFGWKSEEAIGSAHTNPAVLEMWGQYAEACDYVSVSSVAESAQMFASFKPYL